MIRNPKPWPFKGSIWTVSPDGYADFLTIQEAIDAAGDGDVVEVGPGTYTEKLVIQNKFIAIVGSGDPFFGTPNTAPLPVRLSPVLAAGEVAVNIGPSFGCILVIRGIGILPTAFNIAGSATALRLNSGSSCDLHNCKIQLQPSGATVGPFYGIESLTGSQFTITRCAVDVQAPAGGTRRALYVNGTGRVRVYESRFLSASGGEGGVVEVNNASAHAYFFDCELEHGIRDTSSADFYIDAKSVVFGGTRTTPGDPTIEGVTPDGVAWYDTTLLKLRGRENGISKNLLGNFSWLTPAQITANQNNYSPTGLSDADGVRISTDAARTVTGLATGAANRRVKLVNVGSFPIVLLSESAASTAANRFAFDTGAVLLMPNAGIELQYDETSSRWRDEGAAKRTYISRSGTNLDIVSTAAETDVLNVTIPGNVLGTDRSVKIRVSFDRLNNSGVTQTYVLRVRLGATIMYEDTSFAMVASGTRASGFIDLVLSANNATNAQVVNGFVTQGPAGGATTGLGNLASDETDYATPLQGEAAIDSTADMVLRVTVDHTNSVATNSWRRRYYEVVYE